jgi:hypothetical protein
VRQPFRSKATYSLLPSCLARIAIRGKVNCLQIRSTRPLNKRNFPPNDVSTYFHLAKARDLAKDRGLTRAEVMFYCTDNVPYDILIEGTLRRITRYVSPSLVYSSPFSDTWKAYCDAMLHSLVVIDRTRNVGLIVYTHCTMR